MGSSVTPLHYSVFSKPSSPCVLQPPFLFSSPRNYNNNGLTRRKNRGSAISCLKQEQNPQGDEFCDRRKVMIYMGTFVAIPLLNMRRADAVAENTELSTPDPKQEAEGKSSQNPFLSLLNSIGFLGSGVLAALYATIKNEKATSDATIESINLKLKEKEAAITFLEKKFETDLSNEKEARNKALAKANEEKQSLSNQLGLANGTVKSLGQELQKEKRLIEEKTARIEILENSLNKASNEKRELQEQLKEKLDSIEVLRERIDLLSLEIKDKEDSLRNVNSKFVEKESELAQLSSVYQQARDEISRLNLEIEQLKDVIFKKEKEMELNNTELNKLNADLASSRAEIDQYRKKIESLVEEYDGFKVSAEKKADLDAEILRERENAIQEIEERLRVALDDVNKNEVLISDLNVEKEDLLEIVKIESKNAKNLEKELEVARESLNESRQEVADLAKQLQDSRKLCSDLEENISNIRGELSTTKDSLERDIDETKKVVELLAGELKSTKELLIESTEAAKVKSQELAALVAKCDGLEKELVWAREKEDRTVLELNEEREIVSSLKKDLRVLDTRIFEASEARKRLEEDLEASTKSHDEINRNILNLSKDLEVANSRVFSLEDERDAILRSLEEQKEVSKEVRENLEDAHSLVMRLGNERENLENRGKKLEEELASAKGEILRLRSEMNSLKSEGSERNSQKSEGSEEQMQKIEGGNGKSDAPKKRVTRRRKVTPVQEDS
ncbi:hypothetical protein ABFX02_04G102900 [Erythranthe guttata]